MNRLKKWIAREWLCLLGCLGAGVIFVMLGNVVMSAATRAEAQYVTGIVRGHADQAVILFTP